MDYAVVGTGYWGSNHARIGAELLDEGVIDSLVLCDADEERVADLADSYDVPYVTDHTALASLDVDAVTVASPSQTHHDIGIALLDAGLDLLVEKPLALNADDAWALVDRADDAGRTLAVGHIFRTHPALEELKRRIDRGELGRLKYLNTTRFSFRVPRSTTGVLYSLAVHDVDVSNWLLDDTPERCYCQLDRFIRPDIDETASITLQYDGATSVINESWQVPVYGKRRDVVVVGSEAVAYLDYLEDTVLEIYDARVAERNGELRGFEEGHRRHEVETAEPLRVEVERFLAACRSGSEPAAPGHIGARTIDILERLEASDRRNEVVPL